MMIKVLGVIAVFAIAIQAVAAADVCVIAGQSCYQYPREHDPFCDVGGTTRYIKIFVSDQNNGTHCAGMLCGRTTSYVRPYPEVAGFFPETKCKMYSNETIGKTWCAIAESFGCRDGPVCTSGAMRVTVYDAFRAPTYCADLQCGINTPNLRVACSPKDLAKWEGPDF